MQETIGKHSKTLPTPRGAQEGRALKNPKTQPIRIRNQTDSRKHAYIRCVVNISMCTYHHSKKSKERNMSDISEIPSTFAVAIPSASKREKHPSVPLKSIFWKRSFHPHEKEHANSKVTMIHSPSLKLMVSKFGISVFPSRCHFQVNQEKTFGLNFETSASFLGAGELFVSRAYENPLVFP